MVGKDGKGEYTTIDGSAPSGGSKKWIFGVVVLALLGFIGFEVTKRPGAATDAAVAKAALPTSKTGKLKLFDENSEYIYILLYYIM